MPRRLFFIIVFISGWCALTYQVCWERLFIISFGIDFYSVSAIVAAFLTGLGLGAIVIGRFVDRAKSPLKVYALLETGIGLFALISVHYIEALYPLAIALQRNVDSLWLYFFLNFLICFFVMLPPTMLMGGTLPVMIKHLYRSFQDGGRIIGGLYATNTLGSVLGSFMAAFITISLLNVDGSIYFAAGLNLALGAFCYWRSAKAQPAHEESRPIPLADPPPLKKTVDFILSPWAVRVLIALYVFSSLVAIGYEILWFRLVSLVWQNNTGGFGLVLTFYLLGIVIGSGLFAAFSHRISGQGVRIFATLQFLTVITSVLGFFYFRWSGTHLGVSVGEYLLNVYSWMFLQHGEPISPAALLLDGGKLSLAFLALITLPMVIQGACFPLVSRLCVQSYQQVGDKVGWVYWWSIAGSFLGSFGVGYLALPYLGLRGAFIFLISTSLGVGLTGWWLDRASGGPKAHRLFRLAFPFVPFLASIWACAAFVNIPGNIYNYLMASNVTNVTTVVEGITGVTYIKEGPGASYSGLYINSQAHGSLTPYKYNRDDLKAAIAVNLHPRPQNILLIGLGNGRTLTAIERYREIKHIDVVEISRELVPALRKRNDLPWLHRALNSPKVNIILQDGRMFLNRTTKKYDLVLTAPIFAFNAYGGYLYSKQMLELVRDHLTESGVFVLLNDSLTPEMRFIQMKTFKSVFPFFILDNGNYLHGSSQPLFPDMKRIDESWALNKDWLVAPGYAARSKKPYIPGEKGAFLGALRSDQNAFNDLAPFKINTDLEPRTEFWLFNYSRESERRPLPLSRRNLSYALPLDKANLVRAESGWPVFWDQWRIDRWSDSASQAVVKADGRELHVSMPAPGNLKIHTGKRPLGRPPAPDDFQVSQAGTYYFVVNAQAKEPQGLELQVKRWDAKAKKWILKGRKTVFLSPGQVEGYVRFTADGQPAHYCFSMGFYSANQWCISRASLYRSLAAPPRPAQISGYNLLQKKRPAKNRQTGIRPM